MDDHVTVVLPPEVESEAIAAGIAREVTWRTRRESRDVIEISAAIAAGAATVVSLLQAPDTIVLLARLAQRRGRGKSVRI